MKKEGANLFLVFGIVLLLSFSFVSANVFSDIWGKFTGKVIDAPSIGVKSASGYWTAWENRDAPSGNGDFETISNAIQVYPDMCLHPTGIECQTADGQPASLTDQKITCDTTTGLTCWNRDNGGSVANPTCKDYRVRFYCGTSQQNITKEGTYTVQSGDTFEINGANGKIFQISWALAGDTEPKVEIQTDLAQAISLHAGESEKIIASAIGSRNSYNLSVTVNSINKEAQTALVTFTPIYIPICYDSDGGKNYYVQGNISGGYDFGYGQENSLSDHCENNTTLLEYWCGTEQGNRWNYAWEDYNCLNGCGNGACVSTTNQTQVITQDGQYKVQEGDKFDVNGVEGSISRIGWALAGDTEPKVEIQADNAQSLSLHAGEAGKLIASVLGSIDRINLSISVISISKEFKTAYVSFTKISEPICHDSDGGKNYYVQGNISGGYDFGYGQENILSDHCDPENNSILWEYWCGTDQGSRWNYAWEEYFCPYGCSNGACLPENISSLPSDKSSCSSGCSLDGKCVDVGYRQNGKYCSIDGSFVSQLNTDKICDNNFQCGSNLCISGKCVSQGLFDKILSWFKNIFG